MYIFMCILVIAMCIVYLFFVGKRFQAWRQVWFLEFEARIVIYFNHSVEVLALCFL